MSDKIEIAARIFESTAPILSTSEILSFVDAVDEIKKKVMVKGVHYDEPYPGAKEALLKPGSDKLLLAFRVAADPIVTDLSTADEVRFRIATVGHHIVTDKVLGTGLGECSSSEDKYKWRAAVCDEEFDETASDLKRVKWVRGKKGEAAFQVKQIRTHPADLRNTVLKMAKKRSENNLAIVVTACSDMFDQDTEEMDEDGNKKPSQKKTSGTPTSSGTEGNFHIKNWTSKSGGPPEKPWVRFTITTEEGGSFTTFSESHKDEALRLKNEGLLAHIVWKKTQYGNDLVSIAQGKEPEPAPQTAPAGNGSNPPPTNTQSAPPPPNDNDLPPEMRKGYRG